ncbi:hypothetical protein GCM10027049_06510 [Mucilaginibacter puniceus]
MFADDALLLFKKYYFHDLNLMKKVYILFVLCIIICFSAVAQNTYLQSIYLGYAQDSNCKIYKDDVGNAYVIINSRYDINFHGQLYVRHGSSDYSVIGKYNSSGQLLWSRLLTAVVSPNINATDRIYDLKVDKNQNIYISGAGGGITLDDGKNLTAGTFLIKFDKAGKSLWGIISENTANAGNMIGGPIALANDGVYWSSIFYGQLKIQNYTLNNNDPNGFSPNGFVAKVNSSGQITAIYHDPTRASIPQIMVTADNDNAALVSFRGDNTTRKTVILNTNCNVLSEKPFILYGDFPTELRKYNNGYQMLTNLYGHNQNGVYHIGYYDFKFDKNLNMIDSVKLYSSTGRKIYDGINKNDKGYYLNLPVGFTGTEFDWIFMDKNLNQTILKPELKDPNSGLSAFTRNFVKMEGDTLNMQMRRNNTYSTSYTFNNQNYTVSYNLHMSYFWVKYILQDPDSCKKVKVELVQNGREGTRNVKLKFKLPASCPASEDIVIDTKILTGVNDNDITLPSTIVIKQGTSDTTISIPVIDDYYVENTEKFVLEFKARALAIGYEVEPNISFTVEDNENRAYVISYTPQLTEGGPPGTIKVSFPDHVWFKQGLNFNFLIDTTAHQATLGVDYNPINISIPADTNSVTIPLSATIDNVLEGNEFISGKIVADSTNLGAFTSVNNTIEIKIIDIDNVPANRLIDISGINDVLENGKADFSLQLASPYKLQSPLTIKINSVKWFSFLQQSANQVIIDNANPSKVFTITYPDDHVIRTDKNITITLSASDNYLGAFKFRQNNNIISDTLRLLAVDNDLSKAFFQLQPQKLIIREGNSDHYTLKLPEDYVMESNTAVKYTWQGVEINNDKRIDSIINNAVLPAFQNGLQIPIKVLDDNIVNPYNYRQIIFNADNTDFNTRPFDITNIVDIEITDDEIGVLTIPNAFTPNGDGINDSWKIKGLIEGASVDVAIWDRYGSLVYKNLKYFPWDGFYNGNQLPSGTYYYTITNNGKKLASGSVTIIR